MGWLVTSYVVRMSETAVEAIFTVMMLLFEVTWSGLDKFRAAR